MKKGILIILLAVITASCENIEKTVLDIPLSKYRGPDELSDASIESKTLTGDLENYEEKKILEVDRKIIKNAWLNFQVKDLLTSSDHIKKLIKEYDAYIISTNQYDNSHHYTEDLTIRVNADQLDSLLAKILRESLYTSRKSITTQDVTEEFIDIEIRMKNKKEVEKQYLELLKKAKTVGDILKVEKELRIIREEIEAKQGRLNYLKNQVALSTIYLNYYQEKDDIAQAPDKSFIRKIMIGLEGGWKGLLNFIIGLTYTWPFILILGGLGFLIVKWIKKRRLVVRN